MPFDGQATAITKTKVQVLEQDHSWQQEQTESSRYFGFHVLLAGALLLTMMVMPAFANDRPQSFADLAEALSPSVVNISTTTVVGKDNDEDLQFPPGSPFEDFFEEFRDRDNRRTAQALGSGFIVSAEGFVVTNNHVIDGADAIRVTLYNDRSFDATLIGRDPKTDIAVLKIDPGEEILNPVSLGERDA
ncbi:MAG: trypsin-like peptidase domain-containing protein, partial [Proteobacteria bacterium]|nr:trypsin-like peptidase domain-containing protein [Pseudomonadota bacterium]